MPQQNLYCCRRLASCNGEKEICFCSEVNDPALWCTHKPIISTHMQLPPIYKISDTVTITSEHLSNPASIPGGDKRLNFVYKISTLAVWFTQPPTPYLLGGISPVVGRLLHEVYHSPPPSAELKNEWSFPPLNRMLSRWAQGKKILSFVSPICVFQWVTINALPRSHYPEGPATGQIGTSFSWFPCV
jgi:hypothetical protein